MSSNNQPVSRRDGEPIFRDGVELKPIPFRDLPKIEAYAKAKVMDEARGYIIRESGALTGTDKQLMLRDAREEANKLVMFSRYGYMRIVTDCDCGAYIFHLSCGLPLDEVKQKFCADEATYSDVLAAVAAMSGWTEAPSPNDIDSDDPEASEGVDPTMP